MWRKLSLRMEFTAPLCGGVPRDPDVIDRWAEVRGASDAHHANLKAKAELERVNAEVEAVEARNAAEVAGAEYTADAPPVGVKTLEEVRQERQDTIDPLHEVTEQDKVWVGFSRDEHGLFVRGGNLRAHLKDCADVVARAVKAGADPGLPEVKNFRSKVVNSLYVQEDRLHLLDGNGKVATEVTGFRDATLSVMTAQGPRTCLKRVDYLEPCIIQATLLLYPGEISRDWIAVLLDYGCEHGFGQDRSLQFGRYDYELGE